MLLLDASSPRLRPAGALMELWPHQQAMLARCAEVESRLLAQAGAAQAGAAQAGTTAVLADPPGSGKTFVMLGLTLLDREARRGGFDVFVVPQNILVQWQQAVRMFSPTLVCATFTRYADVASGRVGERLLNADLALATPLCFNALAEAMESEGLRARRVVMDEADNGCDALIRRSAPCDVRWIVSASVLNDSVIDEGKRALLSYAKQPVRSRLEVMASSRMCQDPSRTRDDDGAVPPGRMVLCDAGFVAASVVLPEPVLLQVRCGSRELDLMRGLLNDDEDRAAMALDFSALALKHVGRVAADEAEALALLVEDRLLCEEAESERLVDLAREASALEAKEERTETEECHLGMLMARAETSLAERGKHQRAVALVRARLRDRDACLICFSDFADALRGEDRAVTHCCSNSFCSGCLDEWLERGRAKANARLGPVAHSCPICRAALLPADCVVIRGSGDSDRDGKPPAAIKKHPKVLGKLDAIRLLLTEGGGCGSDTIVFSDHGQLFRRVLALVADLGLDCVELDGGNVAEIEAALRRYKGERSEAALSGPRRRRVLLASSMLHGCGLNLENTTDVILVHKLQPDLRSQVIGRAQRPGRTGALRVHQLLFDNEL